MIGDDLALGLDVGTSSATAVALDRGGAVVARAESPIALLTPRPGWTEQDPEAWVAAATDAGARVAAAVGGGRIAAIGLSGQMHGMAALDAADRVVRPALLWNDQRTAAQVALLEERIGRTRMIERTGNPPITGFQLPKVLWLRDEEPEAFRRTTRVLLPKDHVGFRLTGEAIAEPSDASGTGAYHLAGGAWDEALLGDVGLSSALWPRLVRSDAVFGGVRPDAARALGVRPGTPVIAGAGDNAAAATALGLGRGVPRIGSVSLGTSGVIFAPLAVATPDPLGRVHLFAHADGGYHLLAVTLAAAGSLRWFRDTLAPGEGYADLIAAAAHVPFGAHGVTFAPYLAGERTPHLDPTLRGAFHGLSLATTLPDLTRAVLEGVACSLADALEVIAPLAPLDLLLATGGGAASDVWLALLADVLATPIARPSDARGRDAAVGAPEGAALLAWRGLGHAPSRAPQPGRIFAPDPRGGAVAELRGRYAAATRH